MSPARRSWKRHAPAPATFASVPDAVAPGVVQIDSRLGGWAEVTAAYLVEGHAPVLIDPGSRSSVPVVLAALSDLGMTPDDLAGIAVTHVHLDHAGAVGDLARAFPAAAVYVHPEGARHLADPARLLASAGRVHGPLLDSLYGGLEPTPPARIRPLADGEAIDVGGGRSLTAVHAPGHAKHHMALLDSATGTLFAGDAAGVRLPSVGVAWPATPPPDFDLDLALASLARFADLAPSGVALAHFGMAPGVGILDEAAAALLAWSQVAGRALRDGVDVAEALGAAFEGAVAGAGEQARRHLDALNGVASNAAGLRRWFERGRGPTRP